MINFHSFLKFLNRNKVYTAINIFGLAVSLMFVVLIFLYAWQEFSTDSFHKDKDRIYVSFSEINGIAAPAEGMPVSYWLKDAYADIEEVSPVCPYLINSSAVLWRDDVVRTRVLGVEDNFFTFFSFPLVSGNPETVLQDEYSAVVSQTFARKLFGSEDPIGQSLRISDSTTVVVSGVMKDIAHSTIPYADMLFRLERVKEFNSFIAKDNANNAGACANFYKLYPGKDLNAHRESILEMFKERYWIYRLGYAQDVRFVSLKDAYFEGFGTSENLQFSSKRFVWVLFAVGLIILVFAVFNYINLTVAQSGSRAKEMATRRLLGSSRGGIVFRLVVEAILLTAFSFLLGLLLAKAVAPVAESLLQTRLDFGILLQPASILLSLGFVLVIGLLAGILPAVLISSAKPVEVVRGSFRRRSKMVFGKCFITFQNTITVIMLAMSLVMIMQIRHLLHAPLGYNTNNVLNVTNFGDEKTGVLVDKLASLPCVKRVGTSMGTPFDGGNNMSGDYCGEQLSAQWLCFDTTAFNMLGFKIVQKNSLPQTVNYHEQTCNIYLTEYARKAMNLEPDADDFTSDGEHLPISGTVADFRRGNILRMEQPFVIMMSEQSWLYPWNILVEVQGDPVQAYNAVRETMLETTGLEPDMEFLDKSVQASFESQIRMLRIVGIFTGMAVLISILGLVAISIYFIRQRAQETAVRKVFGSDNSAVLFRLVRAFLSYVVIGFIIAAPVVWYLAEKWLSDYAYRISFNPLYIVAAGLFCLLVSFVSVYFQSRRAAHANPIESLRTV